MSLADELTQAVQASPHAKCRVPKILANLNDEDSAALQGMLGLPKEDAPASKIARVLRKYGHDISGEAIARHRRGACACEPI